MSLLQPAIMFDRPIAENGDKTILPASASVIGRASLSEGFPKITETPLTMGGYPPHRLDMNGALYMLSAYAHYYQSGGMWKYNMTLDYTIPCVVYHNGEFWLCTVDNGPGTSAGVRAPSSGSIYWRRVWQELSLNGGLVQFAAWEPNNAIGADGDLCVSYHANLNGAGIIKRALYEKEAGVWVPRIDLSETLVSKVGEVAFFARKTAPAGWLECNGASLSRTSYSVLFNAIGTVFGSNNSNSFKLPDLRGEFIRPWDNGRGVDSGRVFGSSQGDAIRNITGSFDIRQSYNLREERPTETLIDASGIMTRSIVSGSTNGMYDVNHIETVRERLNINAGNQVPIAEENRPRSIALLAAIRYV